MYKALHRQTAQFGRNYSVCAVPMRARRIQMPKIGTIVLTVWPPITAFSLPNEATRGSYGLKTPDFPHNFFEVNMRISSHFRRIFQRQKSQKCSYASNHILIPPPFPVPYTRFYELLRAISLFASIRPIQTHSLPAYQRGGVFLLPGIRLQSVRSIRDTAIEKAG